MYDILTLNKISKTGLERFTDEYQYGDAVENPQGIMVRSASMHEMEMPQSLLAIARAGAGVNNIPVDQCTEKGIVVFNTPGANANAVKELVLAGLLISSRKVTQGMAWAQGLKGQGDAVGKAVEKGKSAFVGPEIKGKKLGVIGLGAIGKRVARRCGAGFGMKVLGHDIVWDDAWASENHVERAGLERIFREADFISLHTSLDDSTRHLVDAPRLALMKPTAILINTARGELVDGPALLEALEQKRIYGAGLDVFEQEPPQDARWYALDNLVMGSHCSSSTSGAVATMGHMAVSNLLRDLGLK